MVELADILAQHGPAYRAKYGDRMPRSHRRALRDIEHCRTPTLGGHVYRCPACAQKQYLYHSCRNRHCPKCQQDKGQRWLAAQRERLLPVSYFMLTFTLPADLRPIARSHQRLIYHLLFSASAQAAQRLARDKQRIGGQVGMLGVLHTWGRSLVYHPHVHYLVPGGGLGEDGHWRPTRANFLLPAKALSKLLRGKFRDALRRANPAVFAQVPAQVWRQDWVVHCQPVGKGVNAVRYLAPYIFRVAISNRRIVRLTNGKVTFRYRATDTGALKTCSLPAEEFIRRFLQHVLPRGFVKVRYYGFLSSGQRIRLSALKMQLGTRHSDQEHGREQDEDDAACSEEKLDCSSRCIEVRCPSCGHVMKKGMLLDPSHLVSAKARAP